MQRAQVFLSNELTVFHTKLKGYLRSNVFVVDTIMDYIVRHKGKRVRPMFVFLSALLNGKPIEENIYRAAACVEIIHAATLIHDDIVDNAYTRRNLPTLNALWKNKIAVLAGDYLLAKGLLIGLANKDVQLLDILSQTVRKMSEAEILQLDKARSLNGNEQTYFQIIEGKTASLIAASCALGAQSTEGNVMYELGKRVGLIFQMRDDLLDFQLHTGKTHAQDLKDKKLTLPLIYTFSQANFLLRKRIIYTIKRKTLTQEHIEWLIDLCHTKGGIAYTQQKIQEHTRAAQDILHTFPPTEIRTIWEELIVFAGQRTF